METALVLSADKWNLTDEKTGELRNGIMVQYINDYREDSDRAIGFKPIKASSTPEVFDAIRKGGAPALYQLDFRTRPGQAGKPTLVIVKAELVRAVKIFEAA